MTRDDYESEDRDAPQPEDVEELDREDDEDEGDDRRCPACGHSAYWGAPKCPHCGEWFAEDQSPRSQQVPGWLWTAIAALLIGVILVMWHGLGR